MAAATGALAQPLSPTERRTLAGEMEQSLTRQLLDRLSPRVIQASQVRMAGLQVGNYGAGLKARC